MRVMIPLLALCTLACMPKTFPEDSLPAHQDRPVDASMQCSTTVYDNYFVAKGGRVWSGQLYAFVLV